MATAGPTSAKTWSPGWNRKSPGRPAVDQCMDGIRLGIDGRLYMAVGDQGILRAVGKDRRKIGLQGGGVIRVRPDGTGLEVVSTGEKNPPRSRCRPRERSSRSARETRESLARRADPSHRGRPLRLSVSVPDCSLPGTAHHGGEAGGAGGQGICYNEDGLPASYRGNLFVCDPDRQCVIRFEIRKAGGTYAIARRTSLVTKGNARRFPPRRAGHNRRRNRVLDRRPGGDETPRQALSADIHRGHRVGPGPRPQGDDTATRIAALDHPALSVRLASQRHCRSGRCRGPSSGPAAADRAARDRPRARPLGTRRHRHRQGTPGHPRGPSRLLAAGSPPGGPELRASRRAGGGCELAALLADRDPAVRREAAIALGRAVTSGHRHLSLPWAIRIGSRPGRSGRRSAGSAIRPRCDGRRVLDPRRRESALILADEAWSVPVVQASLRP